MNTYYVATLSRYVLVEAEDDEQARERGQAALQQQYADLGRNVPIQIYTIRPATYDEIELSKWHHQMVSRERQRTRP